MDNLCPRNTKRPSYLQLLMVPKQFLLLPVPIPKQSQNLEPNQAVDFVSLLKFWTTTWSLGIRKNLFFFAELDEVRVTGTWRQLGSGQRR